MIALDPLHLVACAENERHAVVQKPRHPVEYALATGGASTTGLFHQECNRVCLIDQTQPAIVVALPRVARINVDSATDKNAVRFGDHRGDPAHVEVLRARSIGASEAVVEPGLHRYVPMAIVGGID